jgi:Phage integrase family
VGVARLAGPRWRDDQAADRKAWGEAYETGYVFTAENGEPMHADYVAQRFARLVAAAGVPSIRFHDSRHTHATLLLKAGVPVHVVAQRLGTQHPPSRCPNRCPIDASSAATTPGQQAARSRRPGLTCAYGGGGGI